ncbi:PREDICTED: general transcription factor 3C polypeptide 1 [Nanorana parkeri]|uniref:general transcription factor 3C polypeptide 1 n=1 Tax=Nanorana parkeri TaxID=125878 RepID=UPI000854093B|nr:PREDICTED: general transcription factor 3C polypeptide 1 [Nanorana parkeri]
MEALEAVLDEVALEGLDGITVPALWLRLQACVPTFPLLLDAATKELLWQSLLRQDELDFCELPEERQPLVINNRYEELDCDPSVLKAKGDYITEDIYPVHTIIDNKNGIQGSCRFFKERVSVAEHLRKHPITCEDAVAKWREKLVIVASQTLRFRALIGWDGDPSLKLPDCSYCLLEKIGRSRWQGEIQRDLQGDFKVDAGKIHYIRQVLDRKDLLTMQTHVIKLPSGAQQHSLLLLLKRFHVDRKNKYDTLAERVSLVLSERANRIETLVNLREEMGLPERLFKRLYYYMAAAGIVKIISLPLQEIQPLTEHCKTKRGTDIMVRCVKLIKEYKRKENDDDEDDDLKTASVPIDIIYEKDMLTQTYELIENQGTNGISQREIRLAMNVGKLEARMLCRLLERYMLIKGFMEDEGRQRTTKFISHVFVEESELRRQFLEEKAKSEQLSLMNLDTLQNVEEDKAMSPENNPSVDSHISEDEKDDMSEYIAKTSTPLPPSKEIEVALLHSLPQVPSPVGVLVVTDGVARQCELRRQFLEEKAKSEQLSLMNLDTLQNVEEDKAMSPENNPSVDSHISEDEKDDMSEYIAKTSTPLPPSKGKSCFQLAELDKISVTSENNCSRDSLHIEPNLSMITTHSADEDRDDISVIEEVPDLKAKRGKKSSKSATLEKSRETYRLLKRRNIIVETVKNLRLVESLFTLQKMIVEQERLEGVPTKCCKKSIVRLVQKLSQEGLVRLYRTIVVQDGISKKVEFVVHPSINPSDPLVKSTVEQIRFRMSNSTSGNRARLPHSASTPGKAEPDEQNKENKGEKHKTSLFLGDSAKDVLGGQDSMDVKQLKNYHPIIVPGLGRTLGYLPKMPRLKITHIYLWYIVYGHPMHTLPQQKTPESKPPSGNTQDKKCEDDMPPSCHLTDSCSNTEDVLGPEVEKCITADNTEESTSNTLVCTVGATGHLLNHRLIYVEEESWIRCVPPASLHCDFGPGWVVVSDILLCLPLSIFIQIVQVSYKVDNLEDYLNDPIKKHTLIRHLPRPMRQQLLYKRRYVFSVFQGLQKLSCMGLVQFGPTEKFQEKDQIFVYVKKNATIVDTTACDPHYNLAHANLPFEKRSYRLETIQDVENFWFDLQFVCLNTPLGVVRNSRGKKLNKDNVPGQDIDAESEEQQNLERKCNILESVMGSKEVVDAGSIPGDGLGAGGLDSSFYSHLKRNWIWISYIVNNNKKTKYAQQGFTLRLQTFLNKPMLLLGSNGKKERVFGDMRMSESGELIEMVKETTVCRNKRVCGGKNRKRKKLKQHLEKKQKVKQKKKEKTEEKIKRSRYHDEADQSALQRMTRLRVAWTAQEDGLLMLCRIASNILNRKVNRPFVPWQVVRDIMHSSFEESLDKTSHSIGRRARYIMKNPQTYLNYKVCLAEVYQEKGLVEDFMNRKACYDDLKICAAEFKEFVERLKVKFSTKMDDPASQIPETVDDLFNRFRVLAVGDESIQESGLESINSVEDIQVLVLQNLILSTLALSDMQMKSCRSLQTYRMYRQYHDDILVKAFLEFQKKRLVNRRRGNHLLGPKKNRALPFLPMSFQLSQTYYRLFIWRFPSTICTESFEFLEKLKTYGNTDEPDVFTFGDQTNETSTDMLVYPLDGQGGQCATVLSLLLLGFISVNVKIPDQIVVVDSNLVDNEVINKKSYFLGRDGLDDEDFDDEEVDENVSHKRKIEVKARQASHTNYLLMRGYCAPGIVSTRNLNPNDNVVVNSCQVHVKPRNTPLNGRLKDWGSFSDFTADMPSLPSLFTELFNINDRSDDTFLNHCIHTLGYSSKDVSCAVEIQSAVEACSHFGLQIFDLGKRFLQYEDVGNERTRSLQQYLQDLVTYRQLIQVGGASVRLVARTHASPWLMNANCVKEPATQDKTLFNKDTDCPKSDQQASAEQTEGDSSIYEPPRKKAHLELKIAERLSDPENPAVPVVPINTGNMQTLPKMCTVDAKAMSQENCFLGRPWRIVDGSLNKPVCKGMLEAVLYQIMSKPGITEKDLVHHYSGVLQPVIVIELLQVLEQIGCIKKCYMEKCFKATLCSQCKIPQVHNTSRLSGDLIAFYEPTIDCTLRLGGIFPSEDNWNKWVL